VELRDRLGEVDVNAPVVDEDIVHLDVGPFGRLALLELDEGVLQAVARLLVADHLAAPDLAKAGEDQLEVLAFGDLVQLAHEKDVLRRGHVGEGEVPDHFERQRLGARLTGPACLFDLLLGAGLLKRFLVADAEGGELGGSGNGRGWRNVEADRVVERVICRFKSDVSLRVGRLEPSGEWRVASRRTWGG